MDKLIVKINGLTLNTESHHDDEFEEDPKKHTTENYRTCFSQTKIVQNRDDPLTVLIADLTKLHIGDFDRMWNKRNSPPVRFKRARSMNRSDDRNPKKTAY